MNKRGIIISAGPGCGKTYAKNHCGKYNIIDSDSSRYEKRDNWEKQYVSDLIDKTTSYDFVFASQHPSVVQELEKQCNEKGVKWIFVQPDSSERTKHAYLKNLANRDNSHITKDGRSEADFIKSIGDNWNKWYGNESNVNATEKIRLGLGIYILDILDYLYTKYNKR